MRTIKNIFKSFGITHFRFKSADRVSIPVGTKIRTLWHIALITTGFRSDGRRRATKKSVSIPPVFLARRHGTPCRSYFARHSRDKWDVVVRLFKLLLAHSACSLACRSQRALWNIRGPLRFLSSSGATEARLYRNFGKCSRRNYFTKLWENRQQ